MLTFALLPEAVRAFNLKEAGIKLVRAAPFSVLKAGLSFLLPTFTPAKGNTTSSSHRLPHLPKKTDTRTGKG